MSENQTILALDELEQTLVENRDGLNQVIRVIRTARRHLAYSLRELENARGTTAFILIQQAAAEQEELARNFLNQLTNTQKNVPEPEEVIQLPAKERLQLRSWSPVAKTVIESAFNSEPLPKTWVDLMKTAYGPGWRKVLISSFPGKWGSYRQRTLKEDMSADDSAIRRTVIRGLDVLLTALEASDTDSGIRVTEDIRHVASLAALHPDAFSRIADWKKSR